MPMMSIITVCLNSERTIRSTIESVLNQTYQDFEYIIKDGGSNDNTIKIVSEYLDRFNGRLHIIQRKDKGMYEAMNQAISACCGEIIGIINSDDFYSPYTIEKVVEEYNRSETKLVVIFGDMERINADGETIYRYHFTQEMVDRKACFGHPSMFAAKAVYDLVGLYDTSYSLAADGEWQYRVMEHPSIKTVLVPLVFSFMREGGASDNPKYRWKWFKERSRMRIAHRRGGKFKIYLTEFKKVIRTDIKAILPKSLIKKAYRIRYRK